MTEIQKLPDDIFSVDVSSHELLKLTYNSYLAAKRTSSAVTKRRGEVSGGGKKPWKQKGTGRARFGSSRNPIWRGGGVVFGPLGNENYKLNINKQSKRTALRQALTLASQAGSIQIASFEPSGKTKDAVEFLGKHKIDPADKVLIIVDEKTPEMVRSTDNLENVRLTSSLYLNVYHVLNSDKLVFTPKALELVKVWLGREVKS
jgi:large subunit ribosomal protein L4